MEKLLFELGSIQSICAPGRIPIVCEVVERQRKIYGAMDVIHRYVLQGIQVEKHFPVPSQDLL